MKNGITALFSFLMVIQASAGIIQVPGDYVTIQGAIDSCQSGDSIIVAPGTYNQSIRTNEKSILLASHFFTTNDTGYISRTMLIGTDGPVISVNDGADSVVVIGFTISSGSSDRGAGLNVTYGNVFLENNIITANGTGNWQTGYGGGIYALASVLVLRDNRFEQNESDYGGALYALESAVSIQNCTFRFNSAQEYGGAIWISGTVDFNQNTFVQNWAIRGGGAISCSGNGVISNNLILGQVTSDQTYTGAQYGGAIYCGGTLKIINNRFEKHSGSEGAVIRCRDDVLILNNLFINNTDGLGAGIYIQGDPKIINNTFYGNDGFSIIYFKSGYPEVINNIIWGNTLRNEWKTIHVESGIPTLVPVSYSNIQDGYDGTGNLSVDPQFRDTVNGDFHLKSTGCGDALNSPCIDAGSPFYTDSVLHCLAGLGTQASDMGAYGGGALNPTGVKHEPAQSQSQDSGISIRPNPFNSSTRIEFSLRHRSTVSAIIYNLQGSQVRSLLTGTAGGGTAGFTWDGHDNGGIPCASGVYILNIQINGRSENQKLVLLR